MSVRLDTMRTEVRRRGNFETNDQANAFATDAEINSLLNSYLAEYYDEIIDAKGPAYFRAPPQLITTTPNVASYDLQQGFYKLISVDLTWGPNIVRSARPFEEAERNRFKWVAGWNYDSDVYYQIQGAVQTPSIPTPTVQKIVFQPLPTSATQITVNYCETFVPLTADGHIVNDVNGWTDFAIYNAIADLKDKDDADPTQARARAERIRERIRAMADVDLSEPPRVQVVRRRGWREL